MYRHILVHCHVYLHTFSPKHTHRHTQPHRYVQTIHRRTHSHTSLHNYTFAHPTQGPTQAFSHSCSIHTHTPGCRHKHAGLGSPGFGVTQPPFPCPELQLSVLSGAHTHAKLAGRVTDWQARHQANQAGHSQKQDREVSQLPSSGREGFLPHPGFQPQDQARLTGSSLRRKSPPGEAAGASGQA